MRPRERNIAASVTPDHLSRMRFLRRLSLLLLVAVSLSAVPAQTPSPSPSPTPVQPIGISSVIFEADTAISTLSEIQASLGSDGFAKDLGKFVPKLKTSIDNDITETNRILASPAKISVIQQQITHWSLIRDDANFWTGQLNDRLNRLDQQDAQVAGMTALWKATKKSALAQNAPEDLEGRIQGVIDKASETNSAIDAKRNVLLNYQGQLADQSALVSKTLSSLNKARIAAVDRLLVRDASPLWKAFGAEPHPVAVERTTLLAQLEQSSQFIYRERGKVVLHLAIWAIMVVAFQRARRHVRKWTESDPSLRESTQIFEVPVSTATLLALWIAFPIYPGAPPLLLTLLGAGLIIPLLLVLRQLIERPLFPISWALAAFYLSTQIRAATAGVPLLSRLIFLAESIGGIAFALWLIHTSRFSEKPETGRRLLWRIVGLAARASLLIFIVSAIANIVGYINLALFIGSIFLHCAFLGILLYAACHIVNGLVAFAFKIPPMSLLAMVRHHRPMLERRIARIVRLAAGTLWILSALNKMSLLGETLSALTSFFALPIVAGVTVGGMVTFLLTIWASFLISQFVRFLLEEDVYKRVHLKPGIPFAISMLLHYAILLIGFYLAMAALMGDISKFTVLAGAFGVGIGFGLQNIVNNFVSSLIVLFERPIKIGDLIEVGTMQGTVRQIGIRATVIRTSLGSEIIIPNGKLISDPVTNWTLTNHQRLIQIEITTASAGVDPAKVVQLLQETAASLKQISETPAPEATLTKAAAAGLTFELSAWTADLANIGRLRSDLSIAINEALAANSIPMA